RTDKPRSLTPPPLPPKPITLMNGFERYTMQVHQRLEIFGTIDQICLIFLTELLWAILLKHILILCECRKKIDLISFNRILALVETIQFSQFLNCRKVAESWSNVCRSLSKKSANLV